MRSVSIYGGILVLSLAFAWQRWTKEPSPISGDAIVVLQGDADKLEKIVWKSEKNEAIVEAKNDDHGSYLWVTYTDTKKPLTQKDAPPQQETTSTRYFKAGTSGEKVLKNLSPLLAIRKLSDLDDEKLEKLGLKDPTSHIEIHRKGRVRTLHIGNEAYGTKDLYMQDEETKEVWLIDDEKVRVLKHARSRLPDRRLWSLSSKDIDRLELENAQGNKLTVSHQNRHDPKNAKWVQEQQPDADNTQLSTWLEKTLKLTGSTYADPDKEPENLSLQFRITLHGEKTHETLEVFQEADGKKWWGRSEHTRGLMKLVSRTLKTLNDDLPNLLEAPSLEAVPSKE